MPDRESHAAVRGAAARADAPRVAEFTDRMLAAPLVTREGPWSRAVGSHYLLQPPPGAAPDGRPEPLWSGGAALRGGRYTPRGGGRALYLAPDAATALAEVEAVLLGPSGPEPGPNDAAVQVFQVDGRVGAVLDLCDPAMQGVLGVSEADLLAPWFRVQDRYLRGLGPMPVTQQLGRAAFESGRVVGVRAPSARSPGAANLVVFPDRLAVNPASFLAVHDPHGALPPQRLP